jgi:hypothetical protein
MSTRSCTVQQTAERTAARNRTGWTDPQSRADAAERFWPNVDVRSSGCWRWFGPRDSAGRRTFEWDAGQVISPQAASWLLHFGPLLAGDVVPCCGNSACVRPSHLEATLNG